MTKFKLFILIALIKVLSTASFALLGAHTKLLNWRIDLEIKSLLPVVPRKYRRKFWEDFIN